MSDTSATYPGTGANEARSGSDATWSNPSNITVESNSAEASTPKTEYTDWLRASNFGFSIPSSVSIDGIKVEKRHAQSSDNTTDIVDSSVRLVNDLGENEGDDKASAEAWAADTTYETYTYGGATDMWGTSLTASDINDSDFGVRISAYNGNPDDSEVTLYIQWIKVTVYYTVELSTPTVSTDAVDNIQANQADANGEITDTGGEDCTDRGFVWDTTSRADPGDTAPSSSSYANDWTESGAYSTGTFSHTMTSLDSGTTYYVRACAKNNQGWSYGSEVSFTTEPMPTSTPTVIIQSPADIEDTTATIRGKLTEDGGVECDTRFRWREVGGVWAETAWVSGYVLNDIYTEGLIGLSSSTDHEYQTQARNYLGESAWSASETFKTLDAWTETAWQNTMSAGDIFYEDLINLDPDTKYEFQVKAKNPSEETDWSYSEYFDTLPVFPTQYAGLSIGKDGSGHELCLVAVGNGNTGMGGIPKTIKSGTIYDIYLVETNDPNASPVHIKTSAGIKAIRKKT